MFRTHKQIQQAKIAAKRRDLTEKAQHNNDPHSPTNFPSEFAISFVHAAFFLHKQEMRAQIIQTSKDFTNKQNLFASHCVAVVVDGKTWTSLSNKIPDYFVIVHSSSPAEYRDKLTFLIPAMLEHEEFEQQVLFFISHLLTYHLNLVQLSKILPKNILDRMPLDHVRHCENRAAAHSWSVNEKISLRTYITQMQPVIDKIKEHSFMLLIS